MTEKEVIVELLVEMGVSFQKAAQRLASSSDAPMTTTTTQETTTQVGEVSQTEKETTTTTNGFGLDKMSAKEAMELVTATEDEATLKTIGGEEKARNSKARKGVLTAVQSKLNKLKNPPAQAEVKDETKIFTSSSPAITAVDQKLFMDQFNKLNEEQKSQYFNGEIDSLGGSLIEKAPSNDGEFEDLGVDSLVSNITAEDLRGKLQAYAKANGPEKAYAVLAHFGVKKIAALDPSKYGEVAAELA